ncbi:protein of unknown function [Taphrina deformans PYCC 5710]|uniref:Polyprenal reductase n=1 Tax=Taphrina deformans (strain PYCC 5710 / ATCC 11124 / CBS 356.35 / IMI 108563 / JCM 9778 / NBRC 8474) TaxID=1097556 RepID=R4XE28_TAPDE|nr:protein of unknown function [Taphrina deformans PYCC 5710]|eukprot:CCG84070.1 protein of unknown function [Taphrina deformans PYCC 5710]
MTTVDKDVVILLVRTYFVLATVAVILAQVFAASLRPLLVYGKTRDSRQTQANKDEAWKYIVYLSAFTVPRSWFRHFYVFSSAIGIVILAISYTSRSPGQLLILLLLTHSLRRLLETLLIERPSGSRMWIGHYIVGLTFYLSVNLATVESTRQLRSESYRHPPGLLLFTWRVVLVIAFFSAQYAQHTTHRQLAAIRAQCRRGQYLNPRTGLFKLCIAPHYTAEILMYFSLALFQADNISLWLVVIWTTVVLGTSAIQTNQWGKIKFDDWGERWIILPGLI